MFARGGGGSDPLFPRLGLLHLVRYCAPHVPTSALGRLPPPASVFSAAVCVGAPRRNPLEKATFPFFEKSFKITGLCDSWGPFCIQSSVVLRYASSRIPSLASSRKPNSSSLQRAGPEDRGCGLWAGARRHMSGPPAPLPAAPLALSSFLLLLQHFCRVERAQGRHEGAGGRAAGRPG